MQCSLRRLTSLGRASAHCLRFLTAASNRSQGILSVPMWLNNLSVQLSMFGLVRCQSYQLPNTTHLLPTAVYIPNTITHYCTLVSIKQQFTAKTDHKDQYAAKAPHSHRRVLVLYHRVTVHYDQYATKAAHSHMRPNRHITLLQGLVRVKIRAFSSET